MIKRTIDYLKVLMIDFIFYKKDQVRNLKVLMIDFIFYKKDK